MDKKNISESNLNICYEYHNYIKNYLNPAGQSNFVESINLEIDNPSNYSNFLNNWIDDIFNSDVEEINRFITEMSQATKNSKVDFAWLEGERIAYFTWLILKDGFNYNKLIYIKLNPLPYYKILDTPCSNMRSRIDIIKKYFSIWDDKEEKKNKLITSIQYRWTRIDELKHPFKKLETNKDSKLIEWTWDYILKHYKKTMMPSRIFSNINLTTDKEKYNAIFALHDFIYASDETLHKVFCMEYRQALSSKKFREKEETKTINVQLKVNVKEKLDILKEHYRSNQQQILEMLINDHYKSIKELS